MIGRSKKLQYNKEAWEDKLTNLIEFILFLSILNEAWKKVEDKRKVCCKKVLRSKEEAKEEEEKEERSSFLNTTLFWLINCEKGMFDQNAFIVMVKEMWID